MTSGGTILPVSTYENFLLNSTYTLLNSNVNGNSVQSIGGYIYSVTSNDDTTIFLRGIYPNLAQPINKINKLLIKLVQINDTGPNAYNNKEVVQLSTFVNEFRLHVDIFNKSNSLLEPICPQPLLSGVIDPSYPNIVESYILHNCGEVTAFINQSSNNRIGYIVMELLNGCKSIGTNFNSKTIDEQKILCNAYLYQLMRLKHIGYIHGDTHLNNAMYVNESVYNYSDGNGPRVFIIDFGRTTHFVPSNYTDYPDRDVLTQHENYNWISGINEFNVSYSYMPLIEYMRSVDYLVALQKIDNGCIVRRDAFLIQLYEQQYFNIPDFNTVFKIKKDVAINIHNVRARPCSGVFTELNQNQEFMNGLILRGKNNQKYH